MRGRILGCARVSISNTLELKIRRTLSMVFPQSNHLVNHILRCESSTLAFADFIWHSTTFGDEVKHIQHDERKWFIGQPVEQQKAKAEVMMADTACS